MSLQNPPAGYPVMSGIILTTLITAIVHVSFGIPLFVLNGLGRLGLPALLYAPLAALEQFRPADETACLRRAGDGAPAGTRPQPSRVISRFPPGATIRTSGPKVAFCTSCANTSEETIAARTPAPPARRRNSCVEDW